jgi:hypothetical protein
MMTATGQGLSVLIVTQSDKNWQAFATWYSVFKNLPDATTAICVQRNGDTPFAYYQWTKRLKIPTVHHTPSYETSESMNWLESIKIAVENKLVADQIIVMKPLTMATEALGQKTLDIMVGTDLWVNEDVWFMRKPDINSMIDKCFMQDEPPKRNQEMLCFEANETDDPEAIVSYKKGCGRWIDTSKGCPFSSAGGLVSTEMNANEHRIIDLWKKMVSLYHAVV